MKISFSLFIIVLILSLNSFGESQAEKLLIKADSIRNPAENYKMLIDVKTKDTDTTFEVFLKGQTKTLIVTKSPARDKGRNMLMLDRDFYSYVPNLKRSVRLSLAQKFSGQVANGDIARTRWAGDYTAKIETTNKKEIQLLLDGNKNSLTYQKIRLWIDAHDNKPRRADYLSVDGKTLLKKAWFENYKEIAGNLRPTLIRIEDIAHETSAITIKEMTPKEMDDSFFTQSHMETM